jgi:hypothetical protein
LPFGDRFAQRINVGMRIIEQLLVLLRADAGRLLLELQIGDLLAQRIELALELHAPLIAGAQACRQVVVLAAFGAQGCFAFELERQCILQARLRRRVGEAREFLFRALLVTFQAAACCAAVSMARASSAWRAARLRSA